VLAVSSTGALVAAVDRARSVEFSAYVLRPGRLFDALCSAADRGAAVHVSLEGAPYAGRPHERDELARENARAVARLRAHGAAAELNDDACRPLHLKAAVVDDALYLDDRNWPDDGADTILTTRDEDDVAVVRSALAGQPASDGHLATVKGAALALEARTIARSPSDRIDCESESFSRSSVYGALLARARSGAHVRLLVAERDLEGGRNVRALGALRALQGAGVDVRVGAADEKLCVAGDAAWIGSANASGGRPATRDWGMRTRVPAVVAAAEARFERHWGDAASRPLGTGRAA
jgi:phosphatidylserine/phosphatidylglycerophosphate/cardiolipin synthase-like enzyme